MGVRKVAVIIDVPAGVKCGPGCRCANCENLPRSRSHLDVNGVVQQKQDDLNLRHASNSELVDDENDDETSRTSDCEENLSDEDD